jgi:hypothetical protein
MSPTFLVHNSGLPSTRNRAFSHEVATMTHKKSFLNNLNVHKQLKWARTHENEDQIESPSPKLIIIDWDDTLNPSTWCMKTGILTVRSPSLTELRILRELSVLVLSTLKKCMANGLVVIVTNAETGWVEMSSRALLPDVATCLRGVPVISARTTFESIVRDEPAVWKAMTFSRLISEWSTMLDQNWLLGDSLPEVISIGDASHEREALFHVNSQHEVKFLAKSIKFIERPTFEDLKKQHTMIHARLDAVFASKASEDIRYWDGDFSDHPMGLHQPRPHTIPMRTSKRGRPRFVSPFRSTKKIH